MQQKISKPIRVDIISDVVCPWCIIGYLQLKNAADSEGKTLDVHWHPFELNPQMPAEGQNLREHITEKYGSSDEESATTRERITQVGKELGFEFDFKTESRIMNTFKAHKLLHWVKEKNRQHDLKMVLFRRYFTGGQDMSDKEVLLAAVEELGLDVKAAETVLNKEQITQEVRKSQQFWRGVGVQAVPSMVFDQQHLVTGALGIENYTRVIQEVTEPVSV